MTDKKANTSESEHDLAEITVNDYGKTIDTTVVVEDRKSTRLNSSH